MDAKPSDASAPFPLYPMHPDLLAWAKQTFDMQEFLDDVREIESGGGHTFEEVIAAVEAQLWVEGEPAA